MPSNHADLVPVLNSFRASRWELFCARFLGRRVVRDDSQGIHVILYRWRGREYLVGYSVEVKR